MQDVANAQNAQGESTSTNILAWNRVGKYFSESLHGSYTVSAYRVGEGLMYRASKARRFIGGPVRSPEEAKELCQRDFAISSSASG